MMKCGSPLRDSSLISDASETSDINVCGGVNDQFGHATSVSPLLSEASSYSAKQVRFDSVICLSSLAGELTTNDCTLGEDFTCVTPTRSLSDNLTFTEDCDLTDTLTCDNHGNNEVLAAIPITVDRDSHSANHCYHKDDKIKGGQIAFSCTTDHIPRLPLTVHSPKVQQSTSNLNLGTEGSYRENESLDFIPRPSRTSAKYPSKCEKTAYNPVTPSTSHNLNLLEPKYHTTALLAKEIAELSKCIEKESLEAPNEAKRREAAHLLSEAYNSSNLNGTSAVSPLYLNPALTVNIPEHVETFTNLLNLSVDESEIVRLERQRITAQRKRMAQLRKQAASSRSGGPEPDLLEFFDPNRHIFQSANLHLTGLPRMLPSLCRADEVYSDTVFLRTLSDFARL